ncbi:MAG: c-di-GMP-binding flagellar brake protein YcgR [Oceanicoccus sp.]|jgi:c-di-GMP-binding flagellar brake protein YcgR
MLSSLMGRFKHATTPPQPVDLGLNHSYVKLHQAQRNRSFIEVIVEGDDVVYQSMVLGLDPQERTILIDELFPTGFVGMPGQKIQLSIRQQRGSKLKFESCILEQHQHDGAPIYVLEMPADVETDQRRSAYRLPIGHRLKVSSRFVGPDRQAFKGRVRNVSSTGVSLEVVVDNDDQFSYNDRLRHLTFDFAGLNIDCGVTVRSVEVDESELNKVVIGAEFVDLPALDQRVLERSIMRAQRERLRHLGQLESQLASV